MVLMTLGRQWAEQKVGARLNIGPTRVCALKSGINARDAGWWFTAATSELQLLASTEVNLKSILSNKRSHRMYVIFLNIALKIGICILPNQTLHCLEISACLCACVRARVCVCRETLKKSSWWWTQNSSLPLIEGHVTGEERSEVSKELTPFYVLPSVVGYRCFFFCS